MAMNWYYERKELQTRTPTMIEGRTWSEEANFRREGAKFILDLGASMQLVYSTVATGIIYFHRFYMFQSFDRFPKYLTACSCLFLAGKVEETPKKCRDMIRAVKELVREMPQYAPRAHGILHEFGQYPDREIMTMERILLQTFKFDLQVDHPYQFLLKYVKTAFEFEQSKLERLVQMAWTFVNDSLVTTLCLQWEPEIIAIAMIHLATKLQKFNVAPKWWLAFATDIGNEQLEDICHQLLDIYQLTADGTGGGKNDPLSALRA